MQHVIRLTISTFAIAAGVVLIGLAIDGIGAAGLREQHPEWYATRLKHNVVHLAIVGVAIGICSSAARSICRSEVGFTGIVIRIGAVAAIGGLIAALTAPLKAAPSPALPVLGAIVGGVWVCIRQRSLSSTKANDHISVSE